jgi:predicted ArsR family transcriptional regulator
MLAGYSPMIESTTAMQATIEGLLTTEPITAQEIADKSGATVAVVRLAITTLEHKGKVVSVGNRPVRYCAPAKPAKAPERGDYQVQSSTRYFRPGSYTPPSEKTFTLPGMGDAVEDQ